MLSNSSLLHLFFPLMDISKFADQTTQLTIAEVQLFAWTKYFLYPLHKDVQTFLLFTISSYLRYGGPIHFLRGKVSSSAISALELFISTRLFGYPVQTGHCSSFLRHFLIDHILTTNPQFVQYLNVTGPFRNSLLRIVCFRNFLAQKTPHFSPVACGISVKLTSIDCTDFGIRRSSSCRLKHRTYLNRATPQNVTPF